MSTLQASTESFWRYVTASREGLRADPDGFDRRYEHDELSGFAWHVGAERLHQRCRDLLATYPAAARVPVEPAEEQAHIASERPREAEGSLEMDTEGWATLRFRVPSQVGIQLFRAYMAAKAPAETAAGG